jgi:hypothetical protein
VPPLPARHLGAALAGLLALCALVGCEPAPLTAAPVALSSTTAGFVGDGYQHGPVGSPTYDVVRDAAHPAVLPDGRTLQVFSDTTSMPGATPWYFMTSSAALSPAGDPSTTAEKVVDGHPTALLPWTGAEAAALRPGTSYIGVWPTGAVWVPSGVAGGNQVLITYKRVRVDVVDTAATYTVLGQGAASYRYTTATDALTSGIVATRLQDDLLPGDNDVVMGAPVYDRGWIYLYGCGAAITCFSARARPDHLAESASWMWFDGAAYAGTRAQRRPLPGVGEFAGPAVQWVPAHKAFAMTSSRGDATVSVRWSSSAAGPWTAPQVLTLPGCGPSFAAGGCFGAVVRPESTSSSLTLTYASADGFRTRVASVAVTASPGR